MSIFRACVNSNFFDKDCIVDLSLDSVHSVWSYKQVYESVIQLMNIFEANITKNSVVTLLIPNSVHYVCVFLALSELGLIVSPLDPCYTVHEIQKCMVENHSTCIICIENNNFGVDELCMNLEIDVFKVVQDEFNFIVEKYNKELKKFSYSSLGKSSSIYRASSNDYALRILTSGTTGQPKKVSLSHFNIIFNVEVIQKTYNLSDLDKTILVMPLFHVHGLIGVLLSSLYSGGTVIIQQKRTFSAHCFWLDVVNWKINWFSAVPTILQILLLTVKEFTREINDVKLRFIRSASSHLSTSVHKELESQFKTCVIQSYAMSEASHLITSNPLPSKGMIKIGSVGFSTHTDIQILLPDNMVAPPYVVGEICIKGNNVIQKYNDDKLTDTAFIDGWLRTGDLGYLDSDKYLFLSGRIKDIVNRGGEKIFPLEIDECYMEHPDILECVTYAVPNEKYGEIIQCAIVTKANIYIPEKELIEFGLKKLAPYKIPTKFSNVLSIPKSATGKILRSLVAYKILNSKVTD